MDMPYSPQDPVGSPQPQPPGTPQPQPIQQQPQQTGANGVIPQHSRAHSSPATLQQTLQVIIQTTYIS